MLDHVKKQYVVVLRDIYVGDTRIEVMLDEPAQFDIRRQWKLIHAGGLAAAPRSSNALM